MTNFKVKGANETIYIAGDSNFPPYEFVDSNGQYKGFNVDIMKALSLESSFDVVFVPMPWKDAIQALDTGKVQAIEGMVYSDERAKKYLFSQKILTNNQVIFVRKDTNSIIEKNDLTGKTVAIENGDISEEYIKNIPNIKIVSKQNQDEGIEALLSNKCDAFIGNKYTINYYLEKIQAKDKVKIVGEPVGIRDYSIVTLKNNKKLMDKFNKGIAAIKKNKIYDKVYNKWFGESLLSINDNFKRVLFFILIGGLILVTVMVLVLAVNRRLASLVKKKTLELQLTNEKLIAEQDELMATEEELRQQYEQLSENEEKLQYIAYYDGLTGLPNRAYFAYKLKSLLQIPQSQVKALAVMLIDFDNFKNINDTLGHEFGDEVLIIASKNLKECIGKSDIIFRFGGDEFVIVKNNGNEEKELVECAESILNIFGKSLIVNEQQVYITASIGIACFPDDGTNSRELLKAAETAMYKAKENGRNSYEFFRPFFFDNILRITELEKELRKAIENDEFTVYYQPQVDTITGKVNAVEALIRWNNPVRGYVSPAEFIPLAEDTGLIVRIGEWVVRKACIQNVIWKEKGIKDVCISVNISEVQLRQQDFISKISSIFEETGTDPNYIEFEITESAMMKSMERNIEILKKLRSMGIKIALDDFGTGYSSLNYLRTLPLDNLKIDKSFIDNICTNPDEESIIDGIIFLAHKMKLKVIVEGVENENQFMLLRLKNCDKIQGYYFSKPVNSEEVEKYIKFKNNSLG